jgi:CDP-glucose 4,6-dehydratase
MDESFWRGKRVLVTGHTGFKGAWLSLWLSRLGARVSGYALPPLNPSLFNVARIGSHVDSCLDDIRNGAALNSWMRRQEPEVVFHLAAQPLVRQSYLDPVETYETNVMGTVQLFEAVRTCETVRVVINVTSDKCYENRETAWGYRECDPMGGSDPYSSSKGCAELVTAAYRRSFFSGVSGSAIATARAGNVIGGGDWSEDRLVPDCFRALSTRQPLLLRNPSSVRPWQHVLEPLFGYLTYARRLWDNPLGLPASLNFGPRQEDFRSVLEVVETVIGISQEPLEWRNVSKDALPESKLLVLDSTLARRELGWVPRLTFEQAVELTVSWFRQYRNDADMEQVTISQIDAYQRIEAASPLAASS